MLTPSVEGGQAPVTILREVCGIPPLSRQGLGRELLGRAVQPGVKSHAGHYAAAMPAHTKNLKKPNQIQQFGFAEPHMPAQCSSVQASGSVRIACLLGGMIMSERIWMPVGSCHLGQGWLRIERLGGQKYMISLDTFSHSAGKV